AFVDLTGLRQVYHGSYESIAGKIQDTIKKELGITVSIGVSISKVLAKIGSKHRKPGGLVLIPGRDIHLYLNGLSVGDVWGIGPNTAAYLNKLDINTALEFARKDEGFIQRHLHKPHLEIWHELNGRSIYPVVSGSKSSYQSISKAKTFTPSSNDETFVYAQLSKNLENACIKARRHKLAAIRLIIFLRGQDFRNHAVEIRLSSPTSYPADMFSALRNGFNHIYRHDALYRQTGVVLAGLVAGDRIQMTLFDDPARIEKMSKIYCAVDAISGKFGKHAIQHASSLPAKLQAQHEGERGDVPRRKTELFKGESARQRVGLPVLNIKI
ncbi:MAG: DNA polymerase IV, partial [Deltaproteobacteria bacterium]